MTASIASSQKYVYIIMVVVSVNPASRAELSLYKVCAMGFFNHIN